MIEKALEERTTFIFVFLFSYKLPSLTGPEGCHNINPVRKKYTYIYTAYIIAGNRVNFLWLTRHNVANSRCIIAANISCSAATDRSLTACTEYSIKVCVLVRGQLSKIYHKHILWIEYHLAQYSRAYFTKCKNCS